MIDLSQTDPKYFYDIALNYKDDKDNINTYIVNLTQSANLGYDDAVILLFEEYTKAKDKHQNFKDPNLINFYQTTAENDEYHWSINYLGTMYQTGGKGVDCDKNKAISLYNRAISKLNPYSVMNKANLTEDDFSASSFGENFNNASAQILYIIGRFYDGVYRYDAINVALKYYKMSARKGLKIAKYRIGFVYLYQLKPKNEHTLKKRYKYITQSNNSTMIVDLAECYRIGSMGCGKNNTKAIKLYILSLKCSHDNRGQIIPDSFNFNINKYSRSLHNQNNQNKLIHKADNLCYKFPHDKQQIIQNLYKMCKKGKGRLRDYLNCIYALSNMDMEYEANKIEDLLIESKKYKYVKGDTVIDEVFI